MRNLLALLVVGLIPGLAPAAAGGVRDSQNLFSPEAVERATKKIHDIRGSYLVDLFIETTKEMPAESDEERKAWFKRKARDETMNRWAEKRADEWREQTGFSGIYVVLIDGGFGKRDVRVVAWPTSHGADSSVSWVKRDKLRKMLLAGVFSKEAGERDRTLNQFTETFQDQLRQVRQADPSPMTSPAALFLVVFLVSVWLFLMVVRWRANVRVTPTDPEPMAIYQPAMMGTLFGAPASFWVNDELFRVIPPEVPPVDPGESDSFTLPPDEGPATGVTELPPGGATFPSLRDPGTFPPPKG